MLGGRVSLDLRGVGQVGPGLHHAGSGGYGEFLGGRSPPIAPLCPSPG